jgi:serine kinase of HPr protein (carbohydrate metabolism regulator)
MTNNVQPIGDDSIYVANQEGELIFEIKANTRGGLTIRGCGHHKIDGKVHTSQLIVMPLVSNEIEIHTLEYQP